MKRAVATITVYVYGEDVNELKKEANNIKEIINDDQRCEAEIESLHLKEWGKLGDLKEIKLK